MSWKQFGALGEVLGAVSVSITLLYLSRQISASNKAFEYNWYYGDTEGFNEFHTWQYPQKIWQNKLLFL